MSPETIITGCWLASLLVTTLIGMVAVRRESHRADYWMKRATESERASREDGVELRQVANEVKGLLIKAQMLAGKAP